MIRRQSARKYQARASAVATWRPTRNARKYDSLASWAATMSVQPKNAGRITEWPRLETGNSSVTPWIRPSTIAWKKFIDGSPGRC